MLFFVIWTAITVVFCMGVCKVGGMGQAFTVRTAPPAPTAEQGIGRQARDFLDRGLATAEAEWAME